MYRRLVSAQFRRAAYVVIRLQETHDFGFDSVRFAVAHQQAGKAL
jgi:hypothetical protein